MKKLQILKQWSDAHNLRLFYKLVNDEVVEMEDLTEKLGETWLSYMSHYDIPYIPPEIEHLRHLKRFWFRDVGLRKLPDTLCNITTIEDMSLDRNSLKAIPECLGKITSLRYLDIAENEITALPQSIGALQSLVLFDVSNNRLTNLPNSIGELKKLDRLFLANNPIGRLPESLQECTSLETLDISGTNITPPKWLEEMPSLKKVIGAPELTLYFQKHLEDNEYGQMQIVFRDLFDQDLTEEEVANKEGGMIGDEALPLGQYVWDKKNDCIEYYVSWLPHYRGDSHGKIYKDGRHEHLPTLPQIGEVTQWELDLKEELRKKGLYAY